MTLRVQFQYNVAPSEWPHTSYLKMQIFPGNPVLSSFRQRQLLASLQSVDPAVESVYAEYRHFRRMVAFFQ